MNALDESTPDLTIELRWLRQAIGDLAVRITDKLDLQGPALMDMQQASAYLATTKDSLYDLVKRGGIPFRKVGRKNIFLKKDLDAWLDALPGLSVTQAIASIKPEHRELYLKGSVRIRYEDPTEPPSIAALVRGPKGQHGKRMKSRDGATPKE